MLTRQTKFAGCLLALATLTAPVAAARAQSIGDAMAYAALTLTPAAGLPSTPLTGSGSMPSGWGLRYGHVGPNSDNIALGWYLPAGDGQFTLTGGMTVCDGCNNRAMLGAEWLIPLNDGELRAGLRPAVGAARSTSGDNSYLYAGAMSMPISWNLSSTGTWVVPFVEPGIGYGGISGPGLSESGTRFMTAGGVVITAKDSPLSVLLSARRVFIRNGDTIYGIGVTFNR